MALSLSGNFQILNNMSMKNRSFYGMKQFTIEDLDQTVLADRVSRQNSQSRVTMSRNGMISLVSYPTAPKQIDPDYSGHNGSVCIFEFDGNDWVQLQEIQNHMDVSYIDEYESFGLAVCSNHDGSIIAISDTLAETSSLKTGNVYIYVRTVGGWVLTQTLTPTSPIASQAYGSSLSMSEDGTYLMVGAPQDDDDGVFSGSVYIYKRQAGSYSLQQKITASDGNVFFQFGFSISSNDDGDVLVVGCPKENSMGVNAGCAYVFTRSGVTWTEVKKITQVSTAVARTGSFYGASVSVSGDGETVIIGAPGRLAVDEYPADKFGKAYIYSNNSGAWDGEVVLDETLFSTQLQHGMFGFFVTINQDGTKACVSRVSDRKLYIYEKSGSWTNTTYLEGSALSLTTLLANGVTNSDLSSSTGYTLSMNSTGDKFIAGGFNGGVVIKYDGTWQKEQYIVGELTAYENNYGFCVSTSEDGSTIAISNIGINNLSNDNVNNTFNTSYVGFTEVPGIVSVYIKNGNAWEHQQDLTSAISSGELDYFGHSIALSGDGDYLVVGASKSRTAVGSNKSGSLFLYKRTAGVWALLQTLVPSSPLNDGVMYGYDVAISKDSTIIMASTLQNARAGAVHIFEKNISTWYYKQTIFPSASVSSTFYGSSIDISADNSTIFVSQMNSSDSMKTSQFITGEISNIGYVNVFKKSGGSWVKVDQINAPSGSASGFAYKISCSSDGQTLCVSAHKEEAVSGRKTGTVYIYGYNGTSWVLEHTLVPDYENILSDHIHFGRSLQLSENGEVLVIGADTVDNHVLSEESTILNTEKNGMTMIYQKISNQWVLQRQVTPSKSKLNDRNGYSVDISYDGSTIIVGQLSQFSSRVNIFR